MIVCVIYGGIISSSTFHLSSKCQSLTSSLTSRNSLSCFLWCRVAAQIKSCIGKEDLDNLIYFDCFIPNTNTKIKIFIRNKKKKHFRFPLQRKHVLGSLIIAPTDENSINAEYLQKMQEKRL